MTTEMVQAASQIRQFVVQQFGLTNKESTLTDESSLLASGIIDSLGIMDLILFLEKEFAIKVSDDDLVPENFETIASMTVFVHLKSNQKVTQQS